MNRVLSLLILLSGAAFFALPFVHFSANRLQSGEAHYLWQHTLWLSALLLPLLFIALFARHLPRFFHAWLTPILVAMAWLYILYFSGSLAGTLSIDAGLAARVSWGSGFWCLLFFLALMVLDIWQKSDVKAGVFILFAFSFAVVIWWFIHGHFQDLALLKEYNNQQERFQAAWWQHISLVISALLPTLFFALPLGWLAWRFSGVGRGVFVVLNMIQTIPSIALFAFLMVPLAALAKAYPTLHEMGVSGIGTAPALIALVLYMLLPLVRNTHEALSGVPVAVLEAAKAMGMSKRQVFFAVLLPLSLPVVLSGIRIVLVQSIGLTVIAALIGAGGLGIFVWEGLGEYALDLVLLGAIPTIILALLADLLMQLFIRITQTVESTK